jgi:hypothetical protein
MNRIAIFVINILTILGTAVLFGAVVGVLQAATLVESYNPNQCTVQIQHYKPGVGGKLVVNCTCANPVVTLSPPVGGSQTLTVSCPVGKK